MEALKMQRGSLRGACTKAARALEEHLDSAQPNADTLAALIEQVEEKTKRLQEADSTILRSIREGGTCTEEEYAREFEASESYGDRSSLVRVRAVRALGRLDKEPPTAAPAREVQTAPSSRRYRLPEIELKKFDGNPKDWLGFWGQFSKIHTDNELVPEDKYQYLIQAMVPNSKARELVESFPPTAANYDKAIEHLKGRFGRDEVLVEVYVRDMLRLVLDNALNRGKKDELSILYDRLETQLRALATLGVTTDKYAAMLYPLVESCLPEDSLRAWERSRVTPVVAEVGENGGVQAPQRLEALMQFLRNEIEGEERIKMSRSGFGLEPENRRKQVINRRYTPTSEPTAAGLFSGNRQSSPRDLSCIFCDKRHASHECRQAGTMGSVEKRQILSRKRSCFICLKPGHLARSCKAQVSCNKCSRRHYAVLCPGESQDDGRREDNEQAISNQSSSHALASRQGHSEVLLQTLKVRLKGKETEYVARVLIDSGSQRSYITHRLAELMKYPSLGKERISHLLFGGGTSKPADQDRYRVYLSNLEGSYNCDLDALGQKTICGPIKKLGKGAWVKELSSLGINLTDLELPSAGRSSDHVIDILLGADVAGQLITGQTRQLNSGPLAIETRLGWVVMGKVRDNVQERTTQEPPQVTLLNPTTMVKDLWNLDSLGITDPAETRTREDLEEAAREHFERTVTVTSSGRYEVSLPWLKGHPPLPSNRTISLQRLAGTVKKLKSLDRLKQYQEVFQEWLRDEVIETTEETDAPCHYLPHRGIFKEASETTQLRPVFDASARQRGQPSLNSCLEKGPNLIQQIPGLLTRFRMRRIGVVADIRRAFLQIEVKESDRDFLRFYWWENGDPTRLIRYRHRRVVFGVTSSPFLLAATLTHHLKEPPSNLQETADRLLQSFYVDNCLTSLDDQNQAQTFIEESTTLLATGGWELRDWNKNAPGEVGLPESKAIPVLGLSWNLLSDTLSCEVESEMLDPREVKVTRRTLLSFAHRVFDPIGFTSPVTLVSKLQLQRIWGIKATWDEEIPEEEACKFRAWTAQLPLLKEVKIPRWMRLGSDPDEKIALHLFCDASRLAYAACIYLRISTRGGVSVQLVQARARVAPLKTVTIPRLELLACCIGARLASKTKEDFQDKNIPVSYWTDSSNALCWIKSDACWGPFVRNRVREIQDLSDVQEWRHLPGKHNPADLPSRGCTVQQLLQSRWWEGPTWLHSPPEDWPRSNVCPDPEVIEAEVRKTVVSTLTAIPTASWSNRFSSYWKIIRIIAWMKRFMHNCRAITTSKLQGTLTVDEIDDAEIVLLSSLQSEVFDGAKDPRLRTLQLFQHEKGILRVNTRLGMRDENEEFRFPIVLPGDNPIVVLLIQWVHLQTCHGGVQVLMNKLRERYWILKSRRVIRKVVRECGRCRRYEAKQIDVAPGLLPRERVRDARVFETTGVDLAGPLHLRGGEKGWIVLFTCAVYRAVHLELVTALSTEAFFQSLRRFVARRGRPSTIYSDNGTNFVGADNAFSKLDWIDLQDRAAVQRIRWKFNPPTAAWWGGWWERLIGVLKRILRRVLGRATLGYEEMGTVLCDAEAVMNSRPLTYLSEEDRDLIPLSPAVFLWDLPSTGLPECDVLDNKQLNRRRKYQQRLRDNFRKRFRDEYLAQLRQRKVKGTTSDALTVGEVVLVEKEGSRRLDWPLARITRVIPGRDGKIRLCHLKTCTGELLRPVQRVYRLEVCEQRQIEPERVDLTPVPDKTETSHETGVREPESSDASLHPDANPPEHKTRSGRIVPAPDRLKL